MATLRPFYHFIVETKATGVPCTIIRRHRGYLTYTHFGTATSAYWCDPRWGLGRRPFLFVDQFDDLLPHYGAAWVGITVRVSDDFGVGAQFKAVEYHPRCFPHGALHPHNV